MKFGVREICDVVFKAKSDVTIGNTKFKKGQPVLYIDSAKTSTMEGAATTVYATGGPGNTRLISWEGEKTLTFTVEDALLSPIGFAILSGAGLLSGNYGPDKKPNIHVHRTTNTMAGATEIDLSDALAADEMICGTAPIFVMSLDEYGDMKGSFIDDLTVDETGKKLVGNIAEADQGAVFVDYYVLQNSEAIDELQIDAENFAGYYYVEASTLFRRQADGVDMPVELTFPNVKIQSNFTFAMASTGDPSTFTFTMDAFPGYTYFNPTRKVLCAMQIVRDTDAVSTSSFDTVFPHEDDEKIDESKGDSSVTGVDNTKDFAPNEELSYGSKTISDLAENVEVAWTGTTAKVTGTAKNFAKGTNEWEDLPHDPKDGHFYAVRFDSEKYKDKPFEALRSEDGKVYTRYGYTPKAGDDEMFWILRLDDYKYYRFKSDDDIIATYDFSGMTLEEE